MKLRSHLLCMTYVFGGMSPTILNGSDLDSKLCGEV